MNIDLLETMLSVALVITIIGILCANKILAICNNQWLSYLCRKMSFLVALPGLLAAFFLFMGYVVSVDSGVYEMLVNLRPAYALGVLLACAIEVFLWRMIFISDYETVH